MRARAEGRMPHAVLLTGLDEALLERAVEKLAAVHLGEPNPLSHSDCRVLRPAKKSRRINVESTLEIVSAMHLTSATSRRVVIVHEPDRFQSEAANAFLKSLEEPPPGTLIILQTTRYYGVMSTVLSRCLRFNLGGEAPVIQDPSWLDWLREFDRLVARMINGPSSPSSRVTEVFMPLYALCARFEVLLELFLEEELEKHPAPASDDPEDQKDVTLAHEESVRRRVRARMLVSLQERLRLTGRSHPDYGPQIAQAVELLETARARMELNYQSVAALEQFLLRTLRVFSDRRRAAVPA